MKFSSYNLDKNLVNCLNNLGYYDLTNIQELSLKDALKGKSLICKSATGSGKTHAFIIPILANLNYTVSVQDVIIVPTIELALQCEDFLLQIENQYANFKSVVLTSIRSSLETIKKLKNANKPIIIVATPGRMLDLLKNLKKGIDFNIRTLVFDEADMLFEKTYFEESLEIFKLLKPYQTLVYTATMKEHEISSLKKLLGIEKIIEGEQTRTSKTVRHQLINIRHLSKEDALEKYLSFVKPYFALIFSSKKKDIEEIYNYFINKGVKAYLLTGGMESRNRKALLKKLLNDDIHLLFASDLASRGIDFHDVSHVISLDLPYDLDYYYHRAGRSGRINKEGISAIFYNEEMENKIQKLERNVKFEKYVLKDDALKQVMERKKAAKKKNENLEKEIQREMRKTKSKIKPCYKKKRRTAVIIAKKRHKKKIIRENILAKKRSETT